MYLKKIIAQGFKSFADRVVLSLEHNHITGVIGPNGSGKSNIIDAVRWVMGEQNTKALRGEKATDIIFSGSESRSALSLAEVSLVFDNADASPLCPIEYRHEPEITITRRIYLDGEREYEINKKACRLRDIVSFFTSSALGGKSFSIIQQGQVDRILQAKPEQLRELIEESAGTLVFKQRRAEAQVKLDATNINLGRVEDVEKELQTQLTSLEAQATAARLWQELSQSLRETEVLYLTGKTQQFREKLQSLVDEINDLKRKEAHSLARAASLESQRTQLQQDLDNADPEVAALNEELMVLREKIASHESTLVATLKFLADGEAQLLHVQEQLDADEENLETLGTQHEEAKSNLIKAQSEKGEVEEWLENFEYHLDVLEEEYGAVKKDNEHLREQKQKVERQLDAIRIHRETSKRIADKTAKEKSELTKRIFMLEDEQSRQVILVEGSQIKVAGCQKAIDQELTTKHSLELRLEDCDSELTTKTQQREGIREKLAEKRSLLEALQNNQIPTDVVGAQKKFRELAPEVPFILLTDMLAFNDSSNVLTRKARASFEKWALRLVVTDAAHLDEITKIVNANKLGELPASLLFRARSNEATRLRGNGITFIPLLDLITLNDESEALQTLLSRLFFLSEGADLNSSLEALHEDMVLFCADGHTVNGRADVVLGSPSGKGVLTQKNESKTLAKEIAALEKELVDVLRAVELLQNELTTSKKTLKNSDQTLIGLNKTMLKAIADHEAVKNTIHRNMETVQNLKNELKKHDENAQQVEDNAKLQADFDNLSAEEARLTQLCKTSQAKERDFADRREEMQRQKEDKRIALASAATRSQTIQKSHIQFEAQLDIVQTKCRRNREEALSLQERLTTAKATRLKAQDELADLFSRREVVETKLLEKRGKNAALIDRVRGVEQAIREVQSEERKFVDERKEKELEVERSNSALRSTLDQALEKYNLDLLKAEPIDTRELNFNNLARNVKDYRTRIDEMGPVNMMAIEEFDKLQERNAFILQQKNEILASVSTLNTAIAEIEDNSKKKFLAVFDVLKSEFRKLFPVLFPGGEAQIILTDPENPLTTGVEIIVRLPGKAQQNMSLFSGGEKALTAIALVFALLKSKPTPFCFLDEVDAALDDANIGRYSQVLETLADRFQFVVITHRRQTMEALDTVYGVTMQEPGISKVVSIDLEKSLPPHLQKGERGVRGQAARRQGASVEA